MDIWEKREVLDPHNEIFCSPDFNIYKNILTFVTDFNGDLKQQFHMHMQEPLPPNS